MIRNLASWAKNLERKGNWCGKVIRLIYEICVSAVFQSMIHIFAACFLGALAYKDGTVNWEFIIPFGIIYALFLIVFGISNQHRKIENNITKYYEIAYAQITKMLHEECHNSLTLYNNLRKRSAEEILDHFASHAAYTDTCFRVCEVIDTLLQEISGRTSFRVMTFFRSSKGGDHYIINAYSPSTQIPDTNRKPYYFDLLSVEEGIPVHAEPFLNKRIEPIVYYADEIQKRYKNLNISHPAKLYIGIPCDVNGKVVAALQITSYDESLCKATDIGDLINNVLMVFASYIKVAYTRQVLHELVADKPSDPKPSDDFAAPLG